MGLCWVSREAGRSDHSLDMLALPDVVSVALIEPHVIHGERESGQRILGFSHCGFAGARDGAYGGLEG